MARVPSYRLQGTIEGMFNVLSFRDLYRSFFLALRFEVEVLDRFDLFDFNYNKRSNA